MTPVGDIEIEIVFRIAVRGRTSDLAMLLEAMNKAEAAVIASGALLVLGGTLVALGRSL